MLTHKGTKTIETKRLVLRRFQPGDGRYMFENWASDPQVTQYLTWPAHSSIAVTEIFIVLLSVLTIVIMYKKGVEKINANGG